MYKEDLVHELNNLAQSYGLSHFGAKYINPKENTKSSIIFNDIVYNFHPKSWESINKNTYYKVRTTKTHSNTLTKGLYEMQSSNSSDALAMNIFCFPDFNKWVGTKKLFEVKEFDSIEFGYKPQVAKNSNGDTTEIDVFINESIICECKLSEDDFTKKPKNSVKQYDAFETVFHTDKLIQEAETYSNYQLIRNILAAHQINGRFVLLCDMRRPDLVKSFYQTIRCIKDENLDLRLNCEIIFWQDIAKSSGGELQLFLKEKYGIC